MYLKIVLNDNNLPCFKPIPIPCNSFAGNVCDIDIHSARAREPGQQSFEIKTMNACCKYSRLQHRLQDSFSKYSHNIKWIAPATIGYVQGDWVGEIPQPNQPIVRLLYVITQYITATMFKTLYQHRCGHNAHQNVKPHCFVVLIMMPFQLLQERSDLNAVFSIF